MLLKTDLHERPLDSSSAGPSRGDFGATPPEAHPAPQRRQGEPLRARRVNPLLLMAAGLAVSAAAAWVLVPRLTSASGAAGSATPPALAFSGVAIGGPSDVVAQTASYAPGQSSGWHSHTGLHAVVVLSGTLTIVDGECHTHTYGPGDSYVGGQDVHLALNDTAARLEMAVTYMFPAGISHTGFHVPATAPASCGAP